MTAEIIDFKMFKDARDINDMLEEMRRKPWDPTPPEERTVPPSNGYHYCGHCKEHHFESWCPVTGAGGERRSAMMPVVEQEPGELERFKRMDEAIEESFENYCHDCLEFHDGGCPFDEENWEELD